MASGYNPGNRRIYLTGGFRTGNIDPAHPTSGSSIRSAGTFTPKAPLPVGLGGPGFGIMGGHFYVAGGRNLAGGVLFEHLRLQHRDQHLGDGGEHAAADERAWLRRCSGPGVHVRAGQPVRSGWRLVGGGSRCAGHGSCHLQLCPERVGERAEPERPALVRRWHEHLEHAGRGRWLHRRDDDESDGDPDRRRTTTTTTAATSTSTAATATSATSTTAAASTASAATAAAATAAATATATATATSAATAATSAATAATAAIRHRRRRRRHRLRRLRLRLAVACRG